MASTSLTAPLRAHPLATTTIALLTLSLPYALASYRGYLALGPGGMPYNLLGWAIQGTLQLVAKWNTRDPSPLAHPRNRAATHPHGNRTFFARPLAPRPGARPDVPGYVAPQRQTTQSPIDAPTRRIRMTAFLQGLAGRNHGVLTMRPSKLEGVGTPAVFLDLVGDGLPGFMRGLKGETAHVHPECSSHVTLSMADAEEAVRKGWAERHRLSGVGSMIPWSYVLIYAPRDDAELETWKDIMRAGVRFVCAAAEKEVNVGDE